MSGENKVHHIKSSTEWQTLLKNNTYVAVDFFADWCPPCKAIAPVFESLAAKHAVPGVLAFAKVHVEHVRDVAAMYSITSMPTFMFFKEGKQVAVNGQPLIRGADPRSLGAAAEKLGALAKKRTAASSA
jgi:thioredoxin 1